MKTFKQHTMDVFSLCCIATVGAVTIAVEGNPMKTLLSVDTDQGLVGAGVIGMIGVLFVLEFVKFVRSISDEIRGRQPE